MATKTEKDAFFTSLMDHRKMKERELVKKVSKIALDMIPTDPDAAAAIEEISYRFTRNKDFQSWLAK